MAQQPKPEPEPGSPPVYASTSHRNLKEMTISELVSVLRAAFRMDDFDRVEEVLLARDAKLQTEIGPLRDKIATESLMRIQAEEELKKKEELCQKGKRAQESYESLLKEVKKGDLVDKNTTLELRNKILELEFENGNLNELKKKWVDDGNAVAELRDRVRELEDEKQDDKNILTALKIRNGELEDDVKKRMATIDGLRSENSKLVDENQRLEGKVEFLERKFEELNERVVKLEDDTRLLMSTERETLAEPVVIGVNDEEDVCDYKFGNDNGGAAHLQRNEDTLSLSKRNKDAFGASGSARGKSKLENVEIIDLDDDDDDSTPERLLENKPGSQTVPENEQPRPSSSVAQQKNISAKARVMEMLKRKITLFGTGSSSSDSSSSSDEDDLPIRFLGNSCKKKIKT